MRMVDVKRKCARGLFRSGHAIRGVRRDRLGLFRCALLYRVAQKVNRRALISELPLAGRRDVSQELPRAGAARARRQLQFIGADRFRSNNITLPLSTKRVDLVRFGAPYPSGRSPASRCAVFEFALSSQKASAGTSRIDPSRYWT